MTHETKAQMLSNYANDHYETGGHWVVECWDTVDYLQLLYRCKNNLSEAKLELRAYWERIQEQEAETRWE